MTVLHLNQPYRVFKLNFKNLEVEVRKRKTSHCYGIDGQEYSIYFSAFSRSMDIDPFS